MQYAKIIIVDDDIDDLDILKSSFFDQHYNDVTAFQDGSSVLSYLDSLTDSTTYPNLIIADINMPKMSGMELLEKIKKQARYNSIKVVMFSTAHKTDYVELCKSLGALDFIQKPSSYIEMKKLATHFNNI